MSSFLSFSSATTGFANQKKLLFSPHKEKYHAAFPFVVSRPRASFDLQRFNVFVCSNHLRCRTATIPRLPTSVTMWLYLLADSTGDWRTIVHEGNQDHQRPTLFLEPATPLPLVLCVHLGRCSGRGDLSCVCVCVCVCVWFVRLKIFLDLSLPPFSSSLSV